jgi:hypothetical protein
VRLAPYFLPATRSIYGRPGKRRSHYLYICSDPDPKATIKLLDDAKHCFVELRLGGGGKGAQSVMPGSIHTSGERYEWDEDGAPSAAACVLLKTAIVKIAAGVMLARNWPAKSRHDACLCVGGFLARGEGRADAGPGRKAALADDFDALSDPAGSLLLIDATTAPYVHKYQSVKKFLESPYQETRDVDIATITGVGSSALGSAALAWDISVALEKPVLAIVPGYGVADVVLQGLGGWFAFGLHDFLNSKTLIQTGLATVAPETASVGRELAASTPQKPTARGGAPIFRYGSGSSDVLHALLKHRVTTFRLLVGHSKGALQINNAIYSLPVERTRGLRVVTLGCPIAENVAGVEYHQYLGLFDAPGQLNAWGHWPEYWPPTGTAPIRRCRRPWRSAR